MRRLLSILLLAVLGLGPATSAIPALASGVLSWTGKIDDSRLPACCRRGGKHHCEMGGRTEQANSGETSLAANDTCPFAPQMMAATASPVAAVLTPAFHPTLLASELRVQLAAVTLAVLASRHSQPKRGPPTPQAI